MPLGGGHILRDRRPMADACATIAQNQSAARIVMDAGATRFVRQWPGSANGKESVICRRLQVPVHGSADRQAGGTYGPRAAFNPSRVSAVASWEWSRSNSVRATVRWPAFR